MADFCLQCAQEMGFSGPDLDGLIGPGTSWPGAKWLHTICEGCGDAVVDKDGRCHSDHCLKKHGAQPPLEGA